MHTVSTALALDPPRNRTPRKAPVRLPPGVALPIIGALSLAGWYALWRLGSLLFRAIS
jgi:hypothetical protein